VTDVNVIPDVGREGFLHQMQAQHPSGIDDVSYQLVLKLQEVFLSINSVNVVTINYSSVYFRVLSVMVLTAEPS